MPLLPHDGEQLALDERLYLGLDRRLVLAGDGGEGGRGEALAEHGSVENQGAVFGRQAGQTTNPTTWVRMATPVGGRMGT